MNESPLKDKVLVLMRAEAQLEVEKNERKSKSWQSLAGIDKMDIKTTARPNALQVFVETNKERPLTAGQFVAEHANDFYCMKFPVL